MYGAFVLGVPIFAVIVEYIGKRSKDQKYDNLAREFTKLLAAGFSTTAALAGLLVHGILRRPSGLLPHWPLSQIHGLSHEFLSRVLLCLCASFLCRALHPLPLLLFVRPAPWEME